MDVQFLHVPTPPAWLTSWVGLRPATRELRSAPNGSDPQLRYEVTDGPDFTFINLTIANALALSAEAFSKQVEGAYRTARGVLEDCGASKPVRWWNYVPRIRRRSHDGLDWYMHFNAGRYAAMTAGQDGETLGRQLATASAVGHEGEDFTVHVLAGSAPGVGLENPRQVPAYRYSAGYGPSPPCFSRATGLRGLARADLNGRVLLGGTASVVGERTVHVDDGPAQFEETCANLAALLAHSKGEEPGQGFGNRDEALLELISELRVYVVRTDDTEWIVDGIRRRFASLNRLEVMHAPLCRADLLLEIEGVTGPGVLAGEAEPVLS